MTAFKTSNDDKLSTITKRVLQINRRRRDWQQYSADLNTKLFAGDAVGLVYRLT